MELTFLHLHLFVLLCCTITGQSTRGDITGPKEADDADKKCSGTPPSEQVKTKEDIRVDPRLHNVSIINLLL